MNKFKFTIAPLLLIVLIIGASASAAFGLAAGDYRSAAAGPANWATAGSWQTYNGTSWVAATTYPGQNAGTYEVTIQSGHTITIPDTGISTESMGTVIIEGILELDGADSIATDFDIETTLLIVSTTPAGRIDFFDKCNLNLPANAVINVSLGGLNGDCSQQQMIYIDTELYAICQAQAPGADYDFPELMAAGGSLSVTASATPSTICSGETISLYSFATGLDAANASYDWLGSGPGGYTYTASVAEPADFSLTTSGAYSYTCTVTVGPPTTTETYTNSDTITVTVNPLPNSPTASSTTICNGETTTLTATVNGATGTETVDWYTGSCGGTLFQFGTTAISVSPSADTTYFTRARNTTTGCESTTCTPVAVTVNPLPSDPSSSSSTTICNGESTTLTASVNGATGTEIVDWYTGSCGGTEFQFGTASISVSPSATTTYYARARNTTTSCESTGCAEVTVSVNPTPTVTLGGTTAFCNDSSTTITATPAGGTAPYSYAWTGPGSGLDDTFTATTAGTVSVTVTDDNGCTGTASISVTVNPTPTVTLNGTTAFCNGSSTTITATPAAGTSPYSYDWSASTATGTSSNDTFTASSAGTVSVTVTDANTCTGSASVSVTINPDDTLTLTSGLIDQEVYVNQQITEIVFTYGGGATGASITSGALPAGVTGTDNGSTFTISGTPTADGTFNYTITTSEGSCATATADGEITVLSSPLPTDDRKALNFDQNDGNNDYVYIFDDNTLDLTSTGTLEAWIYPQDFATGTGVVQKGTTATCYGFGFGDTVAEEQNIEFFVVDSGGTEYSLTATGKTIEASQWYHIACVWDTGAADKMIIYVNGISQATSTTVAAARTNNEELRFGMQPVSSNYFQGSLDELRVWNTARGVDDIRTNMCKKLNGAETGLVGYWRLDESNSFAIGDWAGNGNIGIIENATRICSPAPIGDDSAYDYTGTTYSDFTVNLAYGSLDDMTVTGDGGTWDTSEDSCVHVYRVDAPPNYTSASLLWKPFDDSLRYWGVFKAGGTAPTYEMVYHYDGYPDISNENNLHVAFRKNNCDQWKNLDATLSIGDKTLTQSGLNGTEFILGANVDPRNTIVYDGTNDYVKVSDENSLDLTTTGTLEAWIYPEDLTTTAGAGIVFKDTASICYGFGLGGDAGGVFTGGTNTNIGFVVGDSGGGTDYLLTGTTTSLLADKWYHIGCVWDTGAAAGSPNMQIFINGVQEAAYDFSTAMNSATQGTGQLRFGMQNVSSVYFDGRIDEVRIWDVARSQTQIQANMCRKIDTRDSNLVGYWRFDEEATSDTSFDFGTVPYNFATMYGFGTASGIIAARVCSEAPIGDDSAYAYGSPSSATVSHSDGDYFFATNNGGTWTNTYSGLHVYRVDGPPVYPPDISGPLPYNPYVTPNGLTPPTGWASVDYTRYWGVFATDWTTGASQPTYDVIYHYGTVGNGNPNVPDGADPSDSSTPQIGLAYRPAYCYGTWTDSSANWAFGTDQLELLGSNAQDQSQNGPPKTNPEYVLGGKNQPLAIALAYFTASFDDDCIEILWKTATEVDTMGFQLWRSESKEGPYTLVPSSFTASKSVTESQGAAYAFTDCDVLTGNGIEYYYKLEEIDYDNEAENPLYGPIGPVAETVSASQVNNTKASNSSNDACFINSLIQ